ncbi:hypothetical protein V8C86DRAFT_114080 [Haematococcus lacustris]
MSLEELRTEARVNGLEVDPSMKRTALSKLIKSRRDALPRAIKEVQAHLEKQRKAEAEVLERKMGISADASGKKGGKKGKMQVTEFRIFVIKDAKLVKIQTVRQEVVKRNMQVVERSGADPYDQLDEEGEGTKEADDDELKDILKSGLDEGVGDILRSDDTVYGDSGDGDGPTISPLAMTESENFEVTLDFIESRLQNRTAGMSLTFEVLRCFEMLGGKATAADYEALVDGCVADNNPDVALELSDRLPQLLAENYPPSSVAAMFGRLAGVCLGLLRTASADIILERAEDAGLEVEPGLIKAAGPHGPQCGGERGAGRQCATPRTVRRVAAGAGVSAARAAAPACGWLPDRRGAGRAGAGAGGVQRAEEHA